jgi:hypothetical protein
VKTGDLEPAWIIDIASADTTANLSGVSSWELVAWRETVNGQVSAFTGVPVVTPVPGALYRAAAVYDWAAGQTDTEGDLHAVVVAHWPSGDEQSFPSEGSARITIERRIA